MAFLSCVVTHLKQSTRWPTSSRRLSSVSHIHMHRRRVQGSPRTHHSKPLLYCCAGPWIMLPWQRKQAGEEGNSSDSSSAYSSVFVFCSRLPYPASPFSLIASLSTIIPFLNRKRKETKPIIQTSLQSWTWVDFSLDYREHDVLKRVTPREHLHAVDKQLEDYFNKTYVPQKPAGSVE